MGASSHRTFARLLPAAAVTLVATLAAVLLLLPESRHPGAIREAAASLLITRIVDQPLRAFTTGRRRPGEDARGTGRSPRRLERQLGVVVVCAGLVLIPGAVLHQQVESRQQVAHAEAEQQQGRLADELDPVKDAPAQAGPSEAPNP